MHAVIGVYEQVALHESGFKHETVLHERVGQPVVKVQAGVAHVHDDEVHELRPEQHTCPLPQLLIQVELQNG
jgi:hypothetical protein